METKKTGTKKSCSVPAHCVLRGPLFILPPGLPKDATLCNQSLWCVLCLSIHCTPVTKLTLKTLAVSTTHSLCSCSSLPEFDKMSASLLPNTVCFPILCAENKNISTCPASLPTCTQAVSADRRLDSRGHTNRPSLGLGRALK